MKQTFQIKIKLKPHREKYNELEAHCRAAKLTAQIKKRIDSSLHNHPALYQFQEGFPEMLKNAKDAKNPKKIGTYMSVRVCVTRKTFKIAVIDQGKGFGKMLGGEHRKDYAMVLENKNKIISEKQQEAKQDVLGGHGCGLANTQRGLSCFGGTVYIENASPHRSMKGGVITLNSPKKPKLNVDTLEKCSQQVQESVHRYLKKLPPEVYSNIAGEYELPPEFSTKSSELVASPVQQCLGLFRRNPTFVSMLVIDHPNDNPDDVPICVNDASDSEGELIGPVTEEPLVHFHIATPTDSGEESITSISKVSPTMKLHFFPPNPVIIASGGEQSEVSDKTVEGNNFGP